MNDFLSTGLLGLFSTSVVLVVFSLGRWSQRRADRLDPESRAAFMADWQEARDNAWAAEQKLGLAESRVKKLDVALNAHAAMIGTLTRERDAYRAAAESHEVKWPVPIDRSEVLMTKVWDGRPYRNIISVNFEQVEADLKLAVPQGSECTIEVEITSVTGYWVDVFKERTDGVWWTGRRFTGTPERVVAEFKLALSNSRDKSKNYPFIVNNTVGKWNGGGSPICFRVSLWIREPAASATKPLVQLVPQVQTRTEVQVIEVPVFEERVVEKTVPRDLTDAEIDAIVKARVEVELATRKTL